jgi:hypothetical protein
MQEDLHRQLHIQNHEQELTQERAMEIDPKARHSSQNDQLLAELVHRGFQRCL